MRDVWRLICIYIYDYINIHIIYTYCLNSLHEGFVASCTLPVSKGSNKGLLNAKQ